MGMLMKNWIRVANRMINLDHVEVIIQTTTMRPGDPKLDEEFEVAEPCVIIRFPGNYEGYANQIVVTGEDNEKIRFWMDRLCSGQLQMNTEAMKRRDERNEP